LHAIEFRLQRGQVRRFCRCGRCGPCRREHRKIAVSRRSNLRALEVISACQLLLNAPPATAGRWKFGGDRTSTIAISRNVRANDFMDVAEEDGRERRFLEKEADACARPDDAMMLSPFSRFGSRFQQRCLTSPL
jgi:hypothetical protein